METTINCPVTGKLVAAEQCGAAKKDGVIVCVTCGVNLLTGQRIAQEAPRPARRQTNWTLLGVGVLGVLVVAALVGALAWFLLQDPLEDARQAARQNRHLDGIAILQEHTETNPDDAEAYLLLGKLFWQVQRYDNASLAFDAASKLDENNREAALLAVVAASRMEGRDALNQQIAALRRVVEGDPEDAQARYLLALALGSIGDFDEQREHLQRLAGVAVDGMKPEAFTGIAEALQGNTTAAAASLSVAEGQSPSDGDPDAALGLIAHMDGRMAEAEAQLQEALQEGTRIDTLVKTRLGIIYMAQGEFERALPLLRDAKNAGDAPSAAAFFHALALQASGLNSEALLEYERLHSAGGEYADDAAVQMAVLYIEDGNTAKAEEYMRDLAQDGAASAKLYTVQGQLFALQGDLTQAQQSFRRAIQEDPDYAPAHLENGLVYIRRDILAEGLRELETYLTLVANRNAPRSDEIELLVNQLRQTLDDGRTTVEAAQS